MSLDTSSGLPRRSPLLPGESLASLLARLVQLNYYDKLDTLHWILHRRGDIERAYRDLARTAWPRAYTGLAALTGLAPRELFAASDHYFAPILTPPDQALAMMALPDGATRPILTLTMIQKQIRSSRAAQFCPACLQSAAYHRLAWSPAAVAMCGRHRCLLVHRCPQCAGRLSVTETVACECQQCHADLREAPTVSVADDSLGVTSQLALQYWLGVAPRPDWPAGYALPEQPPQVMFRVLDGLRLSLMGCQPDWPRLPAPLANLHTVVRGPLSQKGVMPPETAYHLYRAACTGLLRWPEGFHEFLDAFSQRNPVTHAAVGVSDRLGPLFARWLRLAWKGADFALVHAAFQQYLRGDRFTLSYAQRVDPFKENARFQQLLGLCTQVEAARTLGISERMLDRLIVAGQLVTEDFLKTNAWSYKLLHWKDVLELKQRWSAGLTLAETSQVLGLSEVEVTELARHDMLAVTREAEGAPTQCYFAPESVTGLLETIARQLRSLREARDDLIDAATAANQVVRVGMSSVALLVLLLAGELRGYARPFQPLSDIQYERFAIETLATRGPPAR